MTVVCLTHGKYALIDDEDLPLVNKWRWRGRRTGNSSKYYATNSHIAGTQKHASMHRWILGVTDSMVEVDHIDGDGLNNQRTNLRLATRSQNNANSGFRAANTSGFKGVCWYPKYGNWRAYVRFHGRTKHCGYFADIMEAARAYDRKAVELFGEFALTNEKMGLFEKYRKEHH